MQHDRHHLRRHHIGLAGFGEQDACEVAEVLGGVGHVDRAGFADRLAVVDRFDERQMLGVLVDDVGDGVQDARTLGFIRAAPEDEGLMGGIDGRVHVFARRIGDACDALAVGGAVGVEHGAVGCLDPAAADEKLVGIGNGILHGIAPF